MIAHVGPYPIVDANIDGTRRRWARSIPHTACRGRGDYSYLLGVGARSMLERDVYLELVRLAGRRPRTDKDVPGKLG